MDQKLQILLEKYILTKDPIDAVAFAEAAAYGSRNEIEIWFSDISMRNALIPHGADPIKIFLTELEALIDVAIWCIRSLTGLFHDVGAHRKNLSRILKMVQDNPLPKNINSLQQALENFNQEYMESINEWALVYPKTIQFQ